MNHETQEKLFEIRDKKIKVNNIDAKKKKLFFKMLEHQGHRRKNLLKQMDYKRGEKNYTLSFSKLLKFRSRTNNL